jgi:hypothetical protein
MFTKSEALRTAALYNRTHFCQARNLQEFGGWVVTVATRSAYTAGVDCNSAAKLSDAIASGLLLTRAEVPAAE